jgi:osmoprotectant transport system ATP-binding protein
MITLTALSKRFANAAEPAVDALSLDIGEGEICVLIGPSGCGKTTTMRMINRMVEPDSGTIVVGDRDVTRIDPVELRRSIGYVIQQVGLFPHMTIAENIATVPRLLGWDNARIAKRVDELLERVGVARALAADPPVMLMDEPFGALDPITRASLQDEFLRILRALRKTIVFVTHDIDEAIRMGTRIAIMRAGKLVQYDTPEIILAHPADPFVESFVGADRALKRLSLLAVDGYANDEPPPGDAPHIARSGNLRDALSSLLSAETSRGAVVDMNGVVTGTLTLDAIRGAFAIKTEGHR